MINIIGNITNPLGSAGYKDLEHGGLISFLNNLVSLIIVLAGIFTLINFIAAGYLYLSSNNEPQKLTAANNKIVQSLVGLAIVAIAFVVAGILGYVLFKDSSALLNPQLFKLWFYKFRRPLI